MKDSTVLKLSDIYYRAAGLGLKEVHWLDANGARAIFEAGRASLGLPDVGEPERFRDFTLWGKGSGESTIGVSVDSSGSIGGTWPARGMTADEARFFAAALLAAAASASDRKESGEG